MSADHLALAEETFPILSATASERSRKISIESGPATAHLAELLRGGITSAELLAKTFEPMGWLVPDLIPAEGLTVLGAKMGNGKSYFLLQLAAALSTGGEFLGRHCARQGVLLIALEDSERRMHDRLNQLDIIGTDKLLIATRWAKGKKALEDLRLALQCRPDIKVVIIDPIVKFLELVDENSYAETYGALGPIKDALDAKKVGGIFSHHCKKSIAELDAFDDLLGSTGWGAACDTRLVLRRKRGSPEGTLVAHGRDVLYSESAILFDPCSGWTYEGLAEDVRMSDERKEILDLLDEGPLSATEIAKRLEKNYNTTKVLVRKMVEAGVLVHVGKSVARVAREGGGRATAAIGAIGLQGYRATDKEKKTLSPSPDSWDDLPGGET